MIKEHDMKPGDLVKLGSLAGFEPGERSDGLKVGTVGLFLKFDERQPPQLQHYDTRVATVYMAGQRRCIWASQLSIV